MSLCLGVYQLTFYLKRELNVIIRSVEHNGNYASVGILKRNGFNLITEFTATYALRPLLYVLAEMSDIVVGIVNEHLVVLSIRHNRRITEVTYVVRSALFVEQQIPIDKAVTVIIEVTDHVVSILLTYLDSIHHTVAVFVTAL